MAQIVSVLSLDLASEHVIRMSRLPDPIALIGTFPDFFVSEMADVSSRAEETLRRLVRGRCADDYALAVMDDAGLLIGLGKRSPGTGISVAEWLASRARSGLVLVDRTVQELPVPPESLVEMLDQLRSRRRLAESLVSRRMDFWDLAHNYLAGAYRAHFGVRPLQLGILFLLGAATLLHLAMPRQTSV